MTRSTIVAAAVAVALVPHGVAAVCCTGSSCNGKSPVAMGCAADAVTITYIGYRIHTVRPGHTLSAIATANYGSASAYHDIVRANPLVISDPNLIFVGQALKIPIGA